MTDDIKQIESIVNIALNVKPKDRKRTVETRAETMKILSKMIRDTQVKLIEYQCLKKAVSESKYKENIVNRADALVVEVMEK